LAEDADAIDLGDFFERSEQDPQEMFAELMDLLEVNIKDGPLKQLVVELLQENKIKFCQAPAAKTTHHAYIGGLLTHVLSMARAAIPICEHYGLNKELVIGGVVCHDVGKLAELNFDIGISYSLEGTLLGHVAIGMQMVADKIKQISEFPQQTKIALLHLVASHHGLLAYSAIRVPLTKEALCLHLLDMLDSRLAICDRALKGGVNEEGLTAWVKEMDGPLWAGPE
jgi:3'-5' exoribonuclease